MMKRMGGMGSKRLASSRRKAAKGKGKGPGGGRTGGGRTGSSGGGRVSPKGPAPLTLPDLSAELGRATGGGLRLPPSADDPFGR